MLPKPKPNNLRLRPVSVTTMDHFKRTIDRRFFYPIPGSKMVLRKTRGGSLYFYLACFRYDATISEPDTGKRFSENKHTLHWHKAKICKSVEKNFYLFFIQPLIDMTQMFNMIYR